MERFTEAQYRRAAREEVVREWWVGDDNELEIDPDAQVHVNEQEGYAWVQAWVFVRDPAQEEIQAMHDAQLAELTIRKVTGPIVMTEDVHVRFGGKISLWRLMVRRFGFWSW